MITPDSVFKIGYISKHRGLRGEVELCFTDDCFDTGTSEYLVLDMTESLFLFSGKNIVSKMTKRPF